ncbi:hypothetical protein PLICRDRAFT_141587, partial [Plicaturopsis crispa FD-325 SS-3]
MTGAMSSDPNPFCCRKCGAAVIDIPTPSAASTLSGSQDSVVFPPEAGDYEHSVPAIKQLVAHIDVEVARMRDALDRAVTRRQLLVGFLQDHTGPLADIRRVPPEILSEIFLQSISPAEEQTSFMRHSGRTPMILAQVCRRWRAVALSTSRLWSTIII